MLTVNKIIKLRFLLLVLSGFLINLHAQTETSKVGTTSANFLLIEVGARAIGMGGAFIGVADDATTLYWNPAGSALLTKPTAQYQISKRFAGIDHHFAGVVFPFTSSDKIGVFINYLNTGKMDVTTIQNPEGTGETFDATNLSFGLNYARQLTDRVSIGLTAKFIHEQIWLETASSYAIDIGTIYNIEELGLKIGMNITNLGPDMGISEGPHLNFYRDKPDDAPGSPSPKSQLSTLDYPLPLSFSVGFSSIIVGRNSSFLVNTDHNLLLAVGFNDSFDTPFRTNLGTEYSWKELFFVRGGYRIGYDTQKLSLGFGINFNLFSTTDVTLDYAWVDYNDLGSINVWSLEFRF